MLVFVDLNLRSIVFSEFNEGLLVNVSSNKELVRRYGGSHALSRYFADWGLQGSASAVAWNHFKCSTDGWVSNWTSHFGNEKTNFV